MANEDFWNSLNLIAPSYSTYSVSRKNFDIKKFKKLVENAIKYFSDQKDFHQEVSHISQFIYIGQNHFRMMKGFQEMKKAHQAATRLKRLDIYNALEAFNSYVADDFQSEILLPHRQNLDYLLIKLQGLSKILIRIVTCSRKSARYYLGVIKNGSFYMRGSIMVSTLAKLWNLSRQMCQYTVALYNNLMEFRDKIEKLENSEWIANDCSLPKDLEEWLGDEYFMYANNHAYDVKLLVKPEDVENYRRNITEMSELFEQFKAQDIKSQPNEEEEENDSNKNHTTISEKTNEIDDFTPISRNEAPKSTYEHSLNVKSKEDVKEFIKLEDKYRKVDPEKSITIKKIRPKVWKEIRNDLKNKSLLMAECSLIEYFQDNLSYYLSAE